MPLGLSATAWAAIIVAVLLATWLVATYNSLITRRNRVDESWSDIDVQLKRRYDLIPNLVEAVKGYMKHETSVFEKVTAARAAAMGAKTLDEHGAAENMLTGALKSLFAVAENYPDLKASQNFLQLQDELKDAEDKIQAARRFYNGNVRDFNTAIQTFPRNLVASIFGFAARDFFELQEEAARIAPKVQF
ncbi:LemA family protein [Candidatus Uhrbacteria bacterium]|nr:LemA family protein [Candidatus Uhrbacteria bacterium]